MVDDLTGKRLYIEPSDTVREAFAIYHNKRKRKAAGSFTSVSSSLVELVTKALVKEGILSKEGELITDEE